VDSPASEALPVVSFGLPVRNGAPTIAQAIESVLAQTFENWKLVISDNESTDGTSEFAPPSQLETNVSAVSRRAVTSRFTRTFVRPSFTREARTSGGTETTTGWGPRTPSAPWRRSKRRKRLSSARTIRRYYRDGHAQPVNDPVSVLGGVDSTDSGARVSHASPPVPERRPPRNRPCLLIGTAGRRGADGPSRLHP
jgi:hypothetical protein